MPRTYKCRKCGIEHAPPTGKQCQRQAQLAEEAQSDIQERILAKLDQMNGRMVAMDDRQIAMDNRLQRVETPAADSDSSDEHSEADGESVESENSATRATGQEVELLRNNRTGGGGRRNAVGRLGDDHRVPHAVLSGSLPRQETG